MQNICKLSILCLSLVLLNACISNNSSTKQEVDPPMVQEPITITTSNEVPEISQEPSQEVHLEPVEEVPPLPPPSDKKFILTQVLLYSNADILLGKLIKTYDNSGRITKEEQYNGQGSLVGRKTWRYLARGRVEIIYTTATGRQNGKTIQQWQDDVLLSIENYNAANVLQSKEVYTYDSKGNKIGWQNTDSLGRVTSSEYQWDEGLNSLVNVKNSDGSLMKTQRRFFNVYNQVIREDEFSPEGDLLAIAHFMYTGRYIIRDELRSPDGGLVSGNSYENDVHGNPIKISSFGPNGVSFVYRIQTWEEVSP